MTTMDIPSIPAAAFKRRRAAAYEHLGDGVLILPAAAIQYASRDTERPYCPDRELYYLTGVTEPSAVAVLVGGSEARFVLFVREKDPDAELWAGPRLGPLEAKAVYCPDECYGLAELETRLPDLLSAADKIYARPKLIGEVDRLVSGALERARARGARTGSGPRAVVDPGEVLDELRLIKDEHELAVIRRACEISIQGQRAGARSIVPDVGEWVVEAAVEGAFRSAGANGPGFGTIVGSGENGCVLHYVANRDTVKEGALVLIDAGAEFGLYHGDITRTYPVSGAFSPTQQDLYDIVEAALRAGIESTRPGALIADVHHASTRVLVEGLVSVKVLSGDVDDLISEGAHKPFFPHQTSHWLGLDVHDPGDYASTGVSRTLQPGMVFTVEPGLYFRPSLCDGAAAPFEGIGIRVEDDVVVTASGCEVLTAALPRSASDVAALVGAAL